MRRVASLVIGSADSSDALAAAKRRTNQNHDRRQIDDPCRVAPTRDLRGEVFADEHEQRNPGHLLASASSVSTVKDNPSRSSSIATRLEAGILADGELEHLCRWSGDACTVRDLKGGTFAGTKRSLSSASASNASLAASKWPTCGGSNVPPRTPRRTVGSASGRCGCRRGRARRRRRRWRGRRNGHRRIRHGGRRGGHRRSRLHGAVGDHHGRHSLTRLPDVLVRGIVLFERAARLRNVFLVLDRAIRLHELDLRLPRGVGLRIVLHDIAKIDDPGVVRLPLVVRDAVVVALDAEPLIEPVDLLLGGIAQRRVGIRGKKALEGGASGLAVLRIERRTPPQLAVREPRVVRRAIRERVFGEILRDTGIATARRECTRASPCGLRRGSSTPRGEADRARAGRS